MIYGRRRRTKKIYPKLKKNGKDTKWLLTTAIKRRSYPTKFAIKTVKEGIFSLKNCRSSRFNTISLRPSQLLSRLRKIIEDNTEAVRHVVNKTLLIMCQTLTMMIYIRHNGS